MTASRAEYHEKLPPLINLKRNGSGSVGNKMKISANSYRENQNFSSGFVKASGGVTSNFARYKSIFAVGDTNSQFGKREKSMQNSRKNGGHMT